MQSKVPPPIGGLASRDGSDGEPYAIDASACREWTRDGENLLRGVVPGRQAESGSERRLGRVDLLALEASGVDWSAAISGRGDGWLENALRRATDIFLAACMVLVTLPVMALVALIIKVDSAGPIFYLQERVGVRGCRFTMLKFRSMTTDAERQGPVWASHRDIRVTRVGRIIRLTRIDELPQLFNILAGNMSLVGPRPERPCFVEQLAAQIPHFNERSRVKPGLTGWAQVNLPYGASVNDAREKLSYDLYYVKYRNLWFDLVILFATVRVVVFQVGAR